MISHIRKVLAPAVRGVGLYKSLARPREANPSTFRASVWVDSRSLCGRTFSHDTPAQTMNVTYEDVVRMLNDHSRIVIDVREPQELEEYGRIPGAINIPLSEFRTALESYTGDKFEERYGIPRPDPDAPMVFSCRSGNRSRKAIEAARELGYTNVKNYVGGFMDWKKHSSSPE